MTSDLSSRHALGATGLEVSPLCLGTMQLGWTVDEEASMQLLDTFWEAGGNFIDTANMYGADQNLMSFDKNRSKVGLSEEIIGRWMASRNNRDDMVIATKVRARMWDGPDGEGLSRAHMERALDDSLRRLRVDTVDIYMAHWPDAVPLTETMAVFRDMAHAGKIRTAAASNFPAFLMDDAAAAAAEVGGVPFTSIQPRYSLVNRDEYEDGLLAHCVANGVGVFPFSPLAGGFLTGKYRRDSLPESVRAGFVDQYANDRGWAVLDEIDRIAQAHATTPAAVAIGWMLKQPAVASAVIGANTPQQLLALVPGGSLELSTSELAALDAVSWRESDAEFTSW